MASALVGDVGYVRRWWPDGVPTERRRRTRTAPATTSWSAARFPGTWTYKHLIRHADRGHRHRPPRPPALAAPADDSVLDEPDADVVGQPGDRPGRRPGHATASASPRDADAKSGVVVEFRLPDHVRSWTVPAGVLQDGIAYTWQAIGVQRDHDGHAGLGRAFQDRPADRRRTARHRWTPSGRSAVNLANGNVSTC